jgi:hypothetical protein
LKWCGAANRGAANRRTSHFPLLALLCALIGLGSVGSLRAALAWDAQAADAVAPARVEARSSDLLAVGLVQGERMNIHISRLLDNAPLRDAVVTVVLRGIAHPTVAEADGSYTLNAGELTLPGAATVEFEVAQAQLHEKLQGMLQTAAVAAAPQDKSNGRQMWWWALNFGVCIGFLLLLSRRKKSAET